MAKKGTPLNFKYSMHIRPAILKKLNLVNSY